MSEGTCAEKFRKLNEIWVLDIKKVLLKSSYQEKEKILKKDPEIV